MGSLCYLANFQAYEIKQLLDATILFPRLELVSPVTVDYRFRLTCNLQDTAGKAITHKRIFLNNDGE
jgi:hypothetical protein